MVSALLDAHDAGEHGGDLRFSVLEARGFAHVRRRRDLLLFDLDCTFLGAVCSWTDRLGSCARKLS